MTQEEQFARAMAESPNDQSIRDVFSDYLLEQGRPGCEKKAALLRSGKLTRKRPWRKDVAWMGEEEWSGSEYTSHILPREIIDEMHGFKWENCISIRRRDSKRAHQLWDIFVWAITRWALSETRPRKRKTKEKQP